MNTFTPANPLEEALLGSQQDEASEKAFIALLMESEVGVLLDKPLLADGAWDPEAAPLVMNRPGGFPALAVFTSPGRAVAAGVHSNTYQNGKALPFRALLRGTQPALGLVVNPGSLVGFDMKPEQVAELKHAFGVETVAKLQ
ncbi:MAG TPA: SseB family protein [Holophagaceae bacterium]|nr:SseB family protein [Holophagaceae bacterium]